jgi:hypothetical protein
MVSVFGIYKTWIGIYVLLHENKSYKSLSGFAEAHYISDKPDKKRSANGWRKIEGNWVSTYNL